MNFISLPFLALFIVLFALYWGLRPAGLRRLILLAASFVFYSWLHPWLGIFLGTYTLLNYLVAGRLAAGPRRRFWYWLGLALDLGLLVAFKYFAVQLGGLVGLRGAGWFVPLGISFITLQAISYLTDIYRGSLAHQRDLVNFSLYLALFTKVTAGPVERAKALLPQLAAPAAWSWPRFNEGLQLVVLGYLLKIMVADGVAEVADRVFLLQKPTLFLLGAGALAFTLQIYADFAAYTHLARGFGKLLGIEHVQNFNSPYLSLTPADFWQRWHISFSSWLRDYVFFPLRRWALQARLAPALAVALPAVLTMLVSGAWHGVGWTFIVWGLYYGLLMAGYQQLGLDEWLRTAPGWARFAAWALNFGLVAFGWLIFRAPSLAWLANALLNPIYGRAQDSLVSGAVILLLALFYSLPLLLHRLLRDGLARQQLFAGVYYAALLVLVVIFLQVGGLRNQEFIYFNF